MRVVVVRERERRSVRILSHAADIVGRGGAGISRDAHPGFSCLTCPRYRTVTVLYSHAFFLSCFHHHPLAQTVRLGSHCDFSTLSEYLSKSFDTCEVVWIYLSLIQVAPNFIDSTLFHDNEGVNRAMNIHP